MLVTCKAAFAAECKNFCFYKFHMVLHCPRQIREFGNLDVMDANRQKLFKLLSQMAIETSHNFPRRFEETHLRFAKIPYTMTPKRTATLDADLFKAFVYIEKVEFVCRKVSCHRRFCPKKTIIYCRNFKFSNAAGHRQLPQTPRASSKLELA